MFIEEVKVFGVLMLFGEKYGENVCIIIFDCDFFCEFCGGMYVVVIGEIGFFKILFESVVVVGVCCIEVVIVDYVVIYI